MPAKNRRTRRYRLTPAQQESPDTLSPEESARRRERLVQETAAVRQQQVRLLLNEGARLLRAQRPAEALLYLQQAHDLAPDDPDVAVTLGGALVMSAKWRAAVDFLEKATEQHPDNTRLLLNLAAAYLGRLEFSSNDAQDRAIATYKAAIALDPVAANAHYSIGLIYAERQDWIEAESWFQAALSANPVDADAALWLRRIGMVRTGATDEPYLPAVES